MEYKTTYESRYKINPLFLTIYPLDAVLGQVDQGQTGAWYMYMWNTENRDTGFGWQGDIQHRNWDTTSDLEQLLIQGGFTWRRRTAREIYSRLRTHYFRCLRPQQ